MTAALVGALLALPVGAAAAHPLREGSARLTLRDDHLDVVADLDLLRLVTDAPTALAIAPESVLRDRLATIQQALERGARLEVDGRALALYARGLPSPAELRAVAATLSASGEAHGELIRIHLEAPEAVPSARSVQLILPAALGPILMSFVEPRTAYVLPGTAAAFEVRQPAAGAPVAAAPSPGPGRGWLAMVAVIALTLGALAGRATSRRRAAVSP